MKVCLINPPTTDPQEKSLYFPMALLTLGGVLKRQGVAAELWDFDLYFKRVGNTKEAEFRKLLKAGVQGTRTPLFAISSICSNFPMALWIAREIKEINPKALILLGGPQPSSVPEAILERFDFIDIVAVGEGEITLEEMIAAQFSLDRMQDIPGLVLRRGGEVRHNPKRELVDDMDRLPFPDYDLIRFEDYAAVLGRRYTPSVEVGRGCPFHCTFCSTSLMWEKDFRVKSPERIYREMLHLHERFGSRYIDFIHDNFTTSRKFVLEFCDYLEAHDEKKLTWCCSSRTDCLDVKRLERMHSVGLRGLFFGLETGSERMQKVIKKNLDFQHFEPILERCNQLGIQATTAFILGFPEELPEDMDQTVLKALHYRSMGTSRVFFSKLSALTGTSLYREYLDRFEESNLPSTISPQTYGLPFVKEVVHRYPDLFSSYYHVPHSINSRDRMQKFVEFSHLLVNSYPGIALKILESNGLTPTGLFERWNPWAESKGIPYHNYRIYNEGGFEADFVKFLREERITTDASPLPVSVATQPQQAWAPPLQA
ncbi:MAG: radical SAM protein [bacterium]